MGEPIMSELRRVPAGRAGRLWLSGRLRAGRLAADLLDRKLRVLRLEQERLAEMERRTSAHWRASWQRADTWSRRASVLAGQRGVRLAAPGQPAEVTLTWTNVMGVRYPSSATCTIPEPNPSTRGEDSAALVEASAAHREAVVAAAAHAATTTASRVIEAELVATRRRRHAITDRWIPRLERALQKVAAELDETERADTFRMRWAADARP
jgi:V/A-type H+-transporting ATPase subunit D